jgi:hypothetical protein
MPVGTIVLIILVLLLIGALPSWPYSADWGVSRRESGGGPDRRTHSVLLGRI